MCCCVFLIERDSRGEIEGENERESKKTAVKKERVEGPKRLNNKFE